MKSPPRGRFVGKAHGPKCIHRRGKRRGLNHRGTEDTEKTKAEEREGRQKARRRPVSRRVPIAIVLLLFFSVSSVPLWFKFFTDGWSGRRRPWPPRGPP